MQTPTAPLSARRQQVLGHPVDPVDMGEAVSLVVDRALEGKPGAYVCLTNVHTTVESQDSPALRRAAEGAFLSVPDGMPLVWLLRRRGFRSTEKVTGIEYLPKVAEAGIEAGLRHYFFGGRSGVAAAAGTALVELVPGAQVAGASSPPMETVENLDISELRNDLTRLKPHIVWVGLGAPKQEILMSRLAGSIEVPMMVGVGACFDFLAGTKRAAPRWVSRLGLEWLFRLLAEPTRLWRRYVLGNSRFVFLLLGERLRATRRG